MRWLEYELGLEFSPDGSLKRRVPRELSEVAAQLAQLTGTASENCAATLRQFLAHASSLKDDHSRGVAFKLHQFISQGRTLYATLESREKRQFSLEGQMQAGRASSFSPSSSAASVGRTTTTSSSPGISSCPIPWEKRWSRTKTSKPVT